MHAARGDAPAPRLLAPGEPGAAVRHRRAGDQRGAPPHRAGATAGYWELHVRRREHSCEADGAHVANNCLR